MAKTASAVSASVLSFERKIDPSDATLSSGTWGEWLDFDPIQVREKTVRGVMSNMGKASSTKLESTNIQTVDVAQLPAQRDTLRARFTIRLLPNVGVPFACNSQAYHEQLQACVQSYLPVGLPELTQRYAQNIANARFLWRNRLSSESISVMVRQIKQGQIVKGWDFDAMQQPMMEFNPDTQVQDLAKTIESGLSGQEFVLLEVTAFARMGAGQEVFPSQEMIVAREKGDKSKTLYSVDGCAAMHSQKIGNALRSIDTWYPKTQGDFGPIAIEPFGQITTRGLALRQPNQKADLYTLLGNWINGQLLSLDEQHFVVANLIRGGVFGQSEK